MNIDSKNQIKLTDGSIPSFSPDGKWVVFYCVGGLFKIPTEGGEAVKINTRDRDLITVPIILPDNQAVSFIDTQQGVSNSFKHSLDADNAEQITDFNSGVIWKFDWSKDGKKLALSRGNVTKDVVSITDFK